ncbi:MAG: hypothetical protein M1834_005634 [Cirrosporium novae-zelandiae]|nr:MAG: hypothetical protein M1834_005634 [Cirrosporium novae-zelandiae]
MSPATVMPSPLLRILRSSIPLSHTTTFLKYSIPQCRSIAIRSPLSKQQPPARRHRPSSASELPRSEEETQTDFTAMDVLSQTPAPATSIDACLHDGFHLSNGMKITGGDGILLVDGEAFRWRPWLTLPPDRNGKLNNDGLWGPPKSSSSSSSGVFSLLQKLHPKPDLLILGLGPSTAFLTPHLRQELVEMGIRVEVADTRNAAAMFNLLATERGVGNVAAAMMPIGTKR